MPRRPWLISPWVLLLVALAAGVYLERFSWRQAAGWLAVAGVMTYLFVAFRWDPVGLLFIVAIMGLIALIGVFPDGIQRWRR